MLYLNKNLGLAWLKNNEVIEHPLLCRSKIWETPIWSKKPLTRFPSKLRVNACEIYQGKKLETFGLLKPSNSKLNFIVIYCMYIVLFSEKALIVEYFHKKTLSWMLDWVLNAPLGYFQIILNYFLDFSNYFWLVHGETFSYYFIASSSFFSVNLLFFSSCNYSGCICVFMLFFCNSPLKIRKNQNITYFE